MTFKLEMVGFAPPKLTTTGPDFWYLIASSATQGLICNVSGIGLLAAFQAVLHDALKPGWKGISGNTYAHRPAVDLSVGPETLNATWAYLLMQGWDSDHPVKQKLSNMISSHKLINTLATVAILSTFYWPRFVVADNGTKKTMPPRIARAYVPNETMFKSDKLSGSEGEGVFVPDNVIMWPWSPPAQNVVQYAALAAKLPTCQIIVDNTPHTPVPTPPPPASAPPAPPALPSAPPALPTPPGTTTPPPATTSTPASTPPSTALPKPPTSIPTSTPTTPSRTSPTTRPAATTPTRTAPAATPTTPSRTSPTAPTAATPGAGKPQSGGSNNGLLIMGVAAIALYFMMKDK